MCVCACVVRIFYWSSQGRSFKVKLGWFSALEGLAPGSEVSCDGWGTDQELEDLVSHRVLGKMEVQVVCADVCVCVLCLLSVPMLKFLCRVSFPLFIFPLFSPPSSNLPS